MKPHFLKLNHLEFCSSGETTSTIILYLYSSKTEFTHIIVLTEPSFNPLNPGHFYEFRKFIKISPVGIIK
jgi:hypothetical protein